MNVNEIHTPTLQRAFEVLDNQYMQTRLSRSPVAGTGMLLTGLPNSGKSTIMTAWMRRMELLTRTTHQLPLTEAANSNGRLPGGAEFLPCAYFSAHATLKGFLGHALAFFDEYEYKTSDVHELQTALTTHINTCHTHALGIDQLQSIAHIRAGANRVSESIKYLMDTCPNLFIIGAGIGIEHLEILSDGYGTLGTELGQTGSRFILLPVNPFTLDTPESANELIQVLATIEQHFLLLKSHKNDLVKQAPLIMELTGGRMGNIMQLARTATQTAILTGEERFTPQLLLSVKRSAFAEATNSVSA